MKRLIDYRYDKNFNLEEVSFIELFEGLKSGIAAAVSAYEKKDICEETIRLDVGGCIRALTYGEDGQLYPKLVLSLEGSYSVMLTPFKIQMIVYDYSLKNFRSPELTNSLVDFMCSRFPESDYLEKREEYKIKSKLANSVYDKMILDL